MVVNGTLFEEMQKGSVWELLNRLELDFEKVVVEVCGEIVPKSNYETFQLDERSVIEIVSFVGGG